MKFCRYCDGSKPLDAFSKRAASPDGLSYKCKECNSAYARVRYRANPEKAKANAKAWAAANPARRREIANASAAKNVDKKRAHSREYNKRKRAENPEAARLAGRIAAHKRRVRESGAFDQRAVALVISAARGRCVYCDRLAPLTIDHIDPVSRGGDNGWSNLLPACKSCNSAKGVKDASDWIYDAYGVEGLARTIIAMKNARKIMRRLHPEALHGFPVREV